MATCRRNHFHIFNWLRAKTVTYRNKKILGYDLLKGLNKVFLVYNNKFEDTLNYLITQHKNEQLEWFLREIKFFRCALDKYIVTACECRNKRAFELLCDRQSRKWLVLAFNFAYKNRQKNVIMWLHKINLINISANSYSAYKESPHDIRKLLERLYEIPENLRFVLCDNDKTYDGVSGTLATKPKNFCAKKERHPRKILTKHQRKQIIRTRVC